MQKKNHSHTPPLIAHYDQIVAESQLADDAAQRRVLTELERLRRQLEGPAPRTLIQRLFGIAPATETPMQGLYLWGEVGRGKSMLMDLFFEHVNFPAKRRVHFLSFMQDVHAAIHALRHHGEENRGGADPVIVLGKRLAKESPLLCFDELQAPDVADATLLYRLFDTLFAEGTVIVSTSNRPPAELYRGGVQAERFTKFVALIEEKMQVMALVSPQDYRRTKDAWSGKSYYFPLDKGAHSFVEQKIAAMAKNPRPATGTVHVHGRKLPFTLYDNHIGRFSFADLCEQPLGPADYLAIAGAVDILVLTGIPRLKVEKRNEAKRFVTLIDALYERKVKLVATAEGLPEEIYATGDGAFEFARTVSRLKEMQSHDWWNA